MSTSFHEPPAEHAGRPLQVFAAILLGVAATLTAVATYRAALLDGEALEDYTQSTRALSDSNHLFNQGNEILAADELLFIEYAASAEEGDGDLSAYLTTLMRPELLAAVEWWSDDADATTPFVKDPDNPYVVVEFEQATSQEDLSEAKFEAATRADHAGDVFDLAAVLVALTLFFGGIATLFRRRAVTLALLGFATVTLAAGAAVLAFAFTA